MNHSMWRFVVVCVLVGTSWSCAADEHNCGQPGTRSFMAEIGRCECEPGFSWAFPNEVDYTCVPMNGQAVPLCTPNCRGLACGDDLCGGSCGTCESGTFCNLHGQCEAGACAANCAGRVCGPDPVCAQSCGDCPSGDSCNNAGQCIVGTSVVGAACGGNADCDGDTAACLTEGLPDGYCVIMSCDTAGCPDGSTCLALNPEQTESACFATCETAVDCRDGYECDSYGTCWPPAELP